MVLSGVFVCSHDRLLLADVHEAGLQCRDRLSVMQTGAALSLLDKIATRKLVDPRRTAPRAVIERAPWRQCPVSAVTTSTTVEQASQSSSSSSSSSTGGDPLCFASIAFPPELVMTTEELGGALPRSRSLGSLFEGQTEFKARVRRSRDARSRRNSFTNQKDPPHLPMNSDGNERWPDRICAMLTNHQNLNSRLKMFQFFSAVLGREDPPARSLLVPRSKHLKLKSGAWTISKPGKPNGGEDAFFAGLDDFAGVADGVGEWGDYGCCPRQFAFALMNGSREMALRQPFHARKYPGRDVSPARASERALSVLRSGFERALTERGCFGSSTSLVAGLDEEGERLGIACLGDSSCIVLRRSPPTFKHMTITKRTREQQHFFNCPYQLSRLPEPEDLPQLEERGLFKLIRVLANMKPEMSGDSPDQADLTDIPVKEGDLILLGTDGLFDNLFDHEIISLASLALSPFESRLFFSGSAHAGCSAHAGGAPLACTSALENARRWTEEWVRSGRNHPLAYEPPTVDNGSIATPPEMVARGIAEAAFYRSIDGRARSPFSKAARAAGGAAVGGKQDDITVVACWVVTADDAPE